MSTGVKALSTIPGVKKKGFISLNRSKLVSETFDFRGGDKARESFDLSKDSSSML
jgi:hypothetical protein